MCRIGSVKGVQTWESRLLGTKHHEFFYVGYHFYTLQLRIYLTWGLKGSYIPDGRSQDEKNLAPIFDPEFDFYNPDTQMDMLSLCNSISADRELSQDHVCLGAEQREQKCRSV